MPTNGNAVPKGVVVESAHAPRTCAGGARCITEVCRNRRAAMYGLEEGARALYLYAAALKRNGHAAQAVAVTEQANATSELSVAIGTDPYTPEAVL